jgi:hypothetical protein
MSLNNKEFEDLFRWANTDEPIVFKSYNNIILITLGIIGFFIVVWLVLHFSKNKKTTYELDDSSTTDELEPTGVLENMKYEGNHTKSNIAYLSPKEPPREPINTPELKPKTGDNTKKGTKKVKA